MLILLLCLLGSFPNILMTVMEGFSAETVDVFMSSDLWISFFDLHVLPRKDLPSTPNSIKMQFIFLLVKDLYLHLNPAGGLGPGGILVWKKKN